MNDTLRALFPEPISDETAYHLVNFFYELALAFESIHLGKIMRYEKSRIEFNNQLMSQQSTQVSNAEIELQDPPF
jgi:hypothetical protein